MNQHWTTPFLGKHFLERLEHHARDCGDKPALAWEGGETLDYGTLWRRTGGVARGLAGQGLARGQRVFLVMDGSAASILCYLGSLRLGAVTVPIDPGLTMVQWDSRRADLHPAMVIAPEGLLRNLARSPRPVQGSRIPIQVDMASVFPDLEAHQTLPDGPSNDDVVGILSTTGTTGKAKHVALTLGNISAAAHQINQVMGLTGDDVEVITLPLYHSFGLGRLRCGLAAGSFVHLLPGRFRPERLLKGIRAAKATVFSQVPAGIRLLLALGQRIAPWLAGIRLVEIGSASMDVTEKERLCDLMPHARLWHHYGLTEASRSLFLEYHEARSMNRLSAMGRVTPGVEVILGSDQGRHEGKGDGELLVRGPHVTPGYIHPDGKPGEGLPSAGGWFPTGDLVRRDETGFFFLLGRADDCINLGGFKVHPMEVESVLETCPGIGEVAVAMRHDQEKPFLIAFVAPDPTTPFDERTARDWLASRLEPYKHPQVYHQVPSLPRTPSGKLLRRDLPSV
ncbi:MAG: acyl--CoA ligase [Magnetococcales bacterium]|nr:acyl--CoA ligase [Magnetococcales bacterium]